MGFKCVSRCERLGTVFERTLSDLHSFCKGTFAPALIDPGSL
jgi:hypothetical protein